MPRKLECYTKPKKGGGVYTTCVEGQKGKKAPAKRKAATATRLPSGRVALDTGKKPVANMPTAAGDPEGVMLLKNITKARAAVRDLGFDIKGASKMSLDELRNAMRVVLKKNKLRFDITAIRGRPILIKK